ncbi:cytochrome c-type biogenesis protein CcsB [Candidatus Magnetoovum chiemensis]|nr:cytochrome c-type biogenesis protein CcsB [Candidatus Magnetoovum chiemensis]
MIVLFELALTFYFAATILGIIELVKGSNALTKPMLILTVIGFILHTGNVVLRFAISGHLPTASLHEASSFFTWSIVLIFLIIDYKYRIGLLGSFILPIVFILMLSSSVLPRQIKPLSPMLQGSWLWIHTILAFVGDAALALACGVGVMYLVQEHFVKTKKLGGLFHRLPSLQMLDELNYHLISIGFPLLTVAIISGSMWAESALGTYWRWDPKEVWSLITWLFYALVFHARVTSWARGRRAAILSIVGFLCVLFTFFGVNLLLKGYHGFV